MKTITITVTTKMKVQVDDTEGNDIDEQIQLVVQEMDYSFKHEQIGDTEIIDHEVLYDTLC